MKSKNELLLIAAVKDGDTQAFDRLLSFYIPSLFRTIVGILGNCEEAEDVLQDVLLKVYKNLFSFKAHASFKVWLYRIAINTCNSFLRHRKLKRILSLDWLYESEPGIELESSLDFHSNIDRREEFNRLLSALSGLSKSDRQLLILWAYEELSYEEISGICSIPLGTVKSRLSRAKSQFRKTFLKGDNDYDR